jgi:DNA-directed RNA polymerase specialized sigma24 family protein
MKPAYVSVVIPTNNSFTAQWYHWTHAKVSRNFKRDKERAFEVAQNVRLRLISKDFIGRWFFKHLSHELVDKSQAEAILGGVQVTFVGSIPHAEIPNFACLNASCVKRHKQKRGCVRSCQNSLWKVSDLLEFAKFDIDRFYYSPQNHTIDSNRFLSLLGYPETQYSLLQSLYRQGRILPAEFTEHACVGEDCLECVRGRAILNTRGLSLAHDWSDPSIAKTVAKLRWNDSQLKPFLREWHRMNMVKSTPSYIMRPGHVNEFDRSLTLSPNQGIDAGLLKYAEIIINNEVRNNFKSMARMDDMQLTVFNKGVSPELSDSDQISWETDDSSEGKTRVFRDVFSMDKITNFEHKHDLERVMEVANISVDEMNVITDIDLGDKSIRDFSDEFGKSIQKIHRIRKSALRKLRGDDSTLATRTASMYGCSVSDMLSPKVFVGPAIVARMVYFNALHKSGISISDIAHRHMMTENRVSSSIQRAALYNRTSEAVQTGIQTGI